MIDLSSHRDAIYQIWQPYNLLHLKYPSIQVSSVLYLKGFGTFQLEFETVELYYFKV